MSARPRPSKIEAARRIVANKLRTLPFFCKEQVQEHKAGNIESMFDELLAKSDFVVMVGIETAKESGSQSRTIFWEKVRLFIHVVESPLHIMEQEQEEIEGPLPGAWAYAEEIVAALKLTALENDIFPELDETPLQELPAAQEGSLIVGMKLKLRFEGNSRSTTN